MASNVTEYGYRYIGRYIYMILHWGILIITSKVMCRYKKNRLSNISEIREKCKKMSILLPFATICTYIFAISTDRQRRTDTHTYRYIRIYIDISMRVYQNVIFERMGANFI